MRSWFSKFHIWYFLLLGIFWLFWQLFTDELANLIREHISEGGVIMYSLTHPYIIIPGLLILLCIYALIQAHRRKNKQVLDKEDSKSRKDFSIDWVEGRDGYYFRRLGGEYAYEAKYEADATALILDAVLIINTSRTIHIESLTLDIADKPISSDWQSQAVYKSAQVNLCFDIPLDTPRGERTVRLKAIIDGHDYVYGPYLKNLPEVLRP